MGLQLATAVSVGLRELAAAGLDVIGVEARLVGGECAYWGCIPTKMMVRAAVLLAETKRVEGMAGTASASPDWSPVAQRIRDEATDDWNDQVAVERFVRRGGQFVRGGPGWRALVWSVLTGARSAPVEAWSWPLGPSRRSRRFRG